VKRFGLLLAAGAIAGGISLSAQLSQLPEPRRGFGDSITPAYEGWFYNADGSRAFLVGYYNRNSRQELDIPIGPNNRIEPGGPDLGQPTHFLTGRQWGMFTVKVPANFGTNKLTWTIAANGQTLVIPASLHPDYEISPLVEAAVGNTPPVLRFEEDGQAAQGPAGITVPRTAKVGTSVNLTVWVRDDAKLTTSSGAAPRNLGPPVTVRWTKFRGPGTVTFSSARPEVEKLSGGTPGVPFAGKSTTTATFSAPGEYVLHVVLNDYSGEGGQGFQCCWTNGEVKVSVAP
jgi:hypothetical protein